MYFPLRSGGGAPTDRVNLTTSEDPVTLLAARHLYSDFVLPLAQWQYTDWDKRQLDLLHRYTQVPEKLLTFTETRRIEVMLIRYAHVMFSKPAAHASRKDLIRYELIYLCT